MTYRVLNAGSLTAASEALVALCGLAARRFDIDLCSRTRVASGSCDAPFDELEQS